MKKCSVITGMILASLLLFMNSCEKDYLNAEEISYSLTVSDTVYLNEPVTIKGVINQDLDIRVYWENWNNDHLIGVLKPYRDSIVWIPENIKKDNIQNHGKLHHVISTNPFPDSLFYQ